MHSLLVYQQLLFAQTAMSTYSGICSTLRSMLVSWQLLPSTLGSQYLCRQSTSLSWPWIISQQTVFLLSEIVSIRSVFQ